MTTTTIERSGTRFLAMIHYRPLTRRERIKRAFTALLLALFTRH